MQSAVVSFMLQPPGDILKIPVGRQLLRLYVINAF